VNVRIKIRKKRVLIVIAVAIGLVVLAGGVVVAGNSYRFDEQSVMIPVDGGHLEAVLTTPRGGEPTGLVVMVHGDGPANATQDGVYYPWFEGAADSGWATLSWSKPGIGGSTGDWLAQTLEDRAVEVGVAIDWAKQQTEVPSSQIMLWGISQAGWVLPKVVAARSDIDGVVSVSTAVNWLRQGRYNLEAELDYQGASAAERKQSVAESDDVRAILQRGASYDEYRVETPEENPMSRERWRFVTLNFQSDATDDLLAAASKDIPWYLMAGEYDRNVDMDETERAYRDIFGDQLTVGRFEAAHSMARPIMENSQVVGVTTSIAWPRVLFAPSVLDEYRAFLATHVG